MMKRLVSYIFALGLVFVILGCVGGSPIVNVDNSQLFQKPEKTSKIETAIKNGASKKGWRVKKVKNGLLEVSQLIRGKYLVMVDITYTSKGYKLDYKRSTNLKYDPATNTIHKSYNKWVASLVNNIDAELANIGSLSGNSGIAISKATPSRAAVKYKKGKEISLSGKTIYIKSMAPYSTSSAIAQNIKTECRLNKQVVDFIVKYSANSGVNVVVKNDISPKEFELKIQIDGAVSQGSAMIGHRKSVVISGKIVKGNKEFYSFKAGRISGGGFFGAYKGSCSVLSRSANTLGKDTATWLSSPYNDAVLGDGYLTH